MLAKSGQLFSLLVVVAFAPCRAQGPSRQELERRIAFANAHFAIPAASGRVVSHGTPGSRTDRGRAYIALGPPDHIRDVPSVPNVDAVPYQEWTYRDIPGIGNNVRIEFVDLTFNYGYRMVPPPNGDTEARRRYDLIRKLIQRTLASISSPERKRD